MKKHMQYIIRNLHNKRGKCIQIIEKRYILEFNSSSFEYKQI